MKASRYCFNVYHITSFFLATMFLYNGIWVLHFRKIWHSLNCLRHRSNQPNWNCREEEVIKPQYELASYNIYCISFSLRTLHFYGGKRFIVTKTNKISNIVQQPSHISNILLIPLSPRWSWVGSKLFWYAFFTRNRRTRCKYNFEHIWEDWFFLKMQLICDRKWFH